MPGPDFDTQPALGNMYMYNLNIVGVNAVIIKDFANLHNLEMRVDYFLFYF